MIKIESEENFNIAQEELWDLMDIENKTDEDKTKMEQLATAIKRFRDEI